MTKNIKKFLLLIMVIFLTTGCMKINVNMGISDSKEVTLEMIYAFGMDGSELEDTESDDAAYEEDYDYSSGDDYSSEDEMFSADEMKIDPADFKEMEQYGYKVEEFKEEEKDKFFEGVKLTKSFKNIDDITDSYNEVVFDFTEFMNSEDGEAYKKDHNFFYKKGNNYVANFIFDYTNESEEDTSTDTENTIELLDEEELEELYSTFDLAYSVTLPEKPISHNATTVSADGKTLTWEFKIGEKNEVKYEFALEKDYGIGSIIFIGICGILVVGVVVGLLLIFSNNKKKKLFGSKKMNGVLPTPNIGFNQQPMVPQEQVNLDVQPQMMNQPQVMPQQPMGQVMPEPMVQPMNQSMPQPEMMGQQSIGQPVPQQMSPQQMMSQQLMNQGMPQQPQMMNQPMNQSMAQQSMIPPQQPAMQQQPMVQPVLQQMTPQQPMNQVQPQMLPQQPMNQPQPQVMSQQPMGQPVPQQMPPQQMMSQQPMMNMNQGMQQNINPNDWR